MKTLSVIGCGRVGKTLSQLWARSSVFAIQDLLDHRLENARAAAEFIGVGRPLVDFGALAPATVWMISPPDRHIAGCCEALARSGVLRAGDVVFHCSGALTSGELRAAAQRGASVASAHPLKTFADPANAAETFAGTPCALEGAAFALQVLGPALEAIGGRVFEIDPGLKPVYHAASVIVCNYLTALLEVGARCYEKAGLSRKAAFEAMAPLVRETLDNVLRLGTVQALTGPIARGDHAVVARQLAALSAWDGRIGELYRRLGAIALELSRQQGSAPAEDLARLGDLLEGKDG